ncbi:hypothetical protein GALL_493480 [mine drainage metagenome]|uniref:Uncharacterized protein n=1 Tax=mine drainage metagenome TaxID=410659 RepID=A0A1J5PCJ9_9ZZZZ
MQRDEAFGKLRNQSQVDYRLSSFAIFIGLRVRCTDKTD